MGRTQSILTRKRSRHLLRCCFFAFSAASYPLLPSAWHFAPQQHASAPVTSDCSPCAALEEAYGQHSSACHSDRSFWKHSGRSLAHFTYRNLLGTQQNCLGGNACASLNNVAQALACCAFGIPFLSDRPLCSYRRFGGCPFCPSPGRCQTRRPCARAGRPRGHF